VRAVYKRLNLFVFHALQHYPAVFSLPLLLIGIIYLFPFIWMIGSGVKTNAEFFRLGLAPLPSSAWQWENFERAWDKASFNQYFFNTVVIAAATSLSVILIASMAAFALAQLNVPGTRVVLAALALTFFLPHNFTVLPVFQIIRDLGLLNTRTAIVIVQTAGGLPLNILLFYGYMHTIPPELEEAAISDGASVPQRYWLIVLPLSRPVIATVGLFMFINSWNDFFFPLVLTLSRPDLRTLAVGVYALIGDTSRDWTALCAAATISTVPIMLLFVFLQRQFIDGFTGAIRA
jgi:ABC-type glycerol-3-phosphate transport system permease component